LCLWVCLGRTIKTRLENGQITNPETFKEDTLLTFQNAMK